VRGQPPPPKEGSPEAEILSKEKCLGMVKLQIEA